MRWPPSRSVFGSPVIRQTYWQFLGRQFCRPWIYLFAASENSPSSARLNSPTPGTGLGTRRHHPRRRRAGRFGEGTRRYHPRRRRAVWVGDFVRGMGSGLSCRGGTLEFVAEVLKEFLADL